MNHIPSLRLLLAAQVFLTLLPASEPGAIEGKGAPLPGGPLAQVVFSGGSPDDAEFARVAAALPIGQGVPEPVFQTALAAVRATDRFRTVTGQVRPGPQGLCAEIQLDPWPALEELTLEGLPKAHLLRGLRLGSRVGDLRLEGWIRRFQAHLRESGYPAAQVRGERVRGDRGLKILVTPGKIARIERVAVSGTPAPYSADDLISVAKVVPGKTVWTEVARLEILDRLRKRFLKDDHFEGQVDLSWDPEGVLGIHVEVGPLVRLAVEGDGIGWNVSLKDMVPVARAKTYSPEILDEGERRIVRSLRSKGYLDATVGHRREVLKSGPAGPEEVLVTYTVLRGQRSRVSSLRFERNKEIPSAELEKVADLPHWLTAPAGPKATPDLVDGIEARVRAHYLARGYTEATVRLQPMQKRGGRTDLVFRVYEGPRRLVRWLKLELPAGGFGDPWGLGECLSLILAERPKLIAGATAADAPRRYGSDQAALAGVEGTLASVADPERGGALTLTFTLNKPIPLLKSDLAKVFNALRQQHLSALGVVRPVVRLSLEDLDGGTGVRLEVPAQPLEQVQRLVVQGSDHTRARAVLRETQLKPGAPMDLDSLSRAQARLSFIGAFQRVDMTSLADASPDAAAEPVPAGPPVPWKQGDLLLHLEERSPWLLSSAFGYDNSQGYHLGASAQRLNVGGMGRTLDFGIRAGDGFIDNPTLRRWFPTGTTNRSLDFFTMSYTDPWFAPGLLENWLPDRTQFTAEGAYIQEYRSLYLLRRRRAVASLQWQITPRMTLQTGYRFERVDVSPGTAEIKQEDLTKLAKYEPYSVISAPYAQLVRDTRDNPFDPTQGSYSVARLDLSSNVLGSSTNASFVKLDLRHQWTWSLGDKAAWGIVALGLRVGAAKPTTSVPAKPAEPGQPALPAIESIPLSERFFAGGPFSQRGVQPDFLGPTTQIPLYDTSPPYAQKVENGVPQTQISATGGAGLALINLEYRFPLLGKTVWAELFVDSGQVYESLSRKDSAVSAFPPFRTSVGVGLIFKISVPIKVEYGVDAKRLLGMRRSQSDIDTQNRSIFFSAGFQF